MTVLDTPLRKVSKTVLDKFGTPATLKFMSRLPFDVDRLEAFNESPESVSVRAILAPNKTRFATTPNGTLAQVKDREVLFAALNLPRVPKLGDRLAVGGVEFEFVEIPEEIYSGDEVCLYKVHVKR